MSLQINKIQAKTILIKSGLPGSDYVINPYRGCQFACMYCYAAAIARWQHPDEEWGTYLDIKINAPTLLQTELEQKYQKTKIKDFGSIFFSSVTDPYTNLESQYQLTRQCLQALVDFGYEGKIAIQTKSPLVTRDIDLLKKLKKVSIGLTITSLNDQISQFLEVNAPPISTRLKALKKLHDNGLDTYVFVGPILPYFVNQPKAIIQLLDTLLDHGVTEVWFEHINLSSKIKQRLYQYLQTKNPELIEIFEKTDTSKYRLQLDTIIREAVQKRGMKMGLGKVIYHHNAKK